jgi:molybdopterin-guanine dinucleotide biosynthesis protein
MSISNSKTMAFDSVIKFVKAAGGLIAFTGMVSSASYEFHQSKLGTKFRLRYIRVEPVPAVTLDNTPYVENPIALEVIKGVFDDKYGGMKVLYAPTGSGKTTYLANLAKEYQQKGKHVEFISCAATKIHLYECLDIPRLSYNLSEVIPDGTVIIFDQMERAVFGEELKSMLREVALDSRKIKNYVVIVSLSNKDVAEKILSLNGDDKISALGSASDFHWSREFVSSYVEQSRQYKSWSDTEKQRLVELAARAGAPGFLFNLESLKDPNPASILENKKILAHAESYASSWIAES